MELSIKIKEIHIKGLLEERWVAGWGDDSESGRWYEVAITGPNNSTKQEMTTQLIRTLVTHNSSHFEKWASLANGQYEMYNVVGIHIECVQEKKQGVTAAVIMAVGAYCIIYQPAYDKGRYQKIHAFLSGKTLFGIKLRDQFEKFYNDYNLNFPLPNESIKDLTDEVRKAKFPYSPFQKNAKDLTLNDLSEKIFGYTILNRAITGEGWNDSPLRSMYVMYGTVRAFTCFKLAHNWVQGFPIIYY